MTLVQFRMALAATGKTLAELAAEIEVAPETLSRIRTGAVDPRHSTMMQIEEYFTDLGFRFETERGFDIVAAPHSPD